MSTTTATFVACKICGVATTQAVERRRTTTNAGLPTLTNDYDVGTCEDCATLRPDEPGLAVRAALRVLGKDEADPLAAEAFMEAGVDVAPVLYEDTGLPLGGRGRGGPQRKAFAHVDREGRAALRAGYAALLAARVERADDALTPAATPTPPPEGAPRACLACGQGKAVDWWGPLLTHGLVRGPSPVEGYFCDACGPHLQDEGAVGAPFLERAVMAARGLDYPPPRLRAWVATGLEPRSEPWDWVDTTPPTQTLDPLTALFEETHALRQRVEALEARDDDA